MTFTYPSHTTKGCVPLSSDVIIAEKEGITKEEVQQEIGRAVSIALKSPDPKMQRFWTDFPCENDTPTIEEIIYHLAEKFAKES